MTISNLKAYREMKQSVIDYTRNAIRKTDWELLAFILLFMNVKLIVKSVAILFIYIARPNFRFGLKLKGSRLPLFYMVIPLISFLNGLIYGLFAQPNYYIVFVSGLFNWLLCLLAIHQIKLAVDNRGSEIIHNTILVFFVINAFISVFDLIIIITETGFLNPYLYQGLFQKYFIGTGDYIRGIFFDTSTTNAIVSAFGMVYFLYRKNIIMTFTCMMVVLLTASNLTTILLTIILLGIFIFNSTRLQKSIISACLFMAVLFLARVSPQNKDYAVGILEKVLIPKPVEGPFRNVKMDISEVREKKKREMAKLYLDSLYCEFQKNIKPGVEQSYARDDRIRPTIPGPNLNKYEYQSRTDTTVLQRELIAFSVRGNIQIPKLYKKDDLEKLPGKFISARQTFDFLKKYPVKSFSGNGMGTFSSKLAYRATALNVAGGYNTKYVYINPAFKANHLPIFLYYFIKTAGYHSFINTTDSVYDQMLGEYGLLGILGLLILYFFFFLKQYKRLSYGIPLLFILAAAFCFGYWFEQLSIVVIFELILLTDIKGLSSHYLYKTGGL
jgi:hypothetical protein